VEVLATDLRQWLVCRPPPGCNERTMAVPAVLLPWRGAGDWAVLGIDEAFAVAPTLAGQPAETGALARRADEPLVAAALGDGRRVAARLAARRADLDFLARGLLEPELLQGWLGGAPVAPGVGLARVETARGLLLHLMQVKDGRVAGYVIVAPTEWNFHAQGAFAGEIVGSPAATRDEAEGLARRLALALDPCVSYEVVVEETEDA
jgi:coenzyme F420-reducing hydrogenase alpha subunit